MLEPDKLEDAGFLKFCNFVNSTVGFSTTEVLYAWYYDTLNQNQKTTSKNEGKNK